MLELTDRLRRIKPSASSMAGQRVRELRAAGRDVIGLTAGEPDFETPLHIRQAAWAAMNAGQTRYTDVGGAEPLRHAVAEKFRRENGLDYGLSEIIVSAGAKQIIFNALMCTVQQGDEVIVPAPYWVSYPDITRFAGGRPVFVPCPPDNGFKLRPQDLEQALCARTRWLILNSPNNPSGATYTRAELLALAEVLERYPQVWVLADDIYEHLTYDNAAFVTLAQAAPSFKERTLTVNGVSKAYAMTGWRIGYAGAPAPLIRAMVTLQSQSTSGANAVAQAAAIAALDGPQDFIATNKALLQARRDRVVAALGKIDGIACRAPAGAFYVLASCAALMGARTPQGALIRCGDDWTDWLLDAQGLAVLQGSAYGVDSHFRLSFATSSAQLDEGCRRIAAAAAALTPAVGGTADSCIPYTQVAP
ncbi:pyridoxal phosphate-dependent aminotransferase [Verminephrobacter aporrectodeae subsp. tuberculatae]|uniref:pyridoxal phosphate-dependent aminotransferase n=1 Tax=Verminephrobacter aporrectodeae TaxID=1110389 RepID=UPI0022433D91|nr:pyridoxal phosphate-dependent aminotransferase [Verminephrobacter aporrectodeae]MCW8206859.1 pyridoxal phosphate-dependent aminotransferase [Verminephrobacter aporrectodeae subsp. tuberculatae]